MVATLRAFLVAWLAKGHPFVAWLLGHFGIVSEDRDEEGGEHVHR